MKGRQFAMEPEEVPNTETFGHATKAGTNNTDPEDTTVHCIEFVPKCQGFAPASGTLHPNICLVHSCPSVACPQPQSGSGHLPIISMGRRTAPLREMAVEYMKCILYRQSCAD
mmetsp:Transcript_69222/g.110724  ORF Transcript_69222/g.110724 Transcript_69222/m.110724 type:complete len:113 (-) Transcript_69222:100-438(-)